MANLRTKDGANQDRYIKAGGSGTDADPTFVAHSIVSDTGESGIVLAASSALRVTGVTVQDVRQATASALNATVVGAIEARQSNASALRGTMEIYQAAPSALRGTMEVYQATASAFQATVTQAAAASGWTARLVTPSGDTAMDTGLSALRTYLVGGSVAGLEVRQANASALKFTGEIYQAAPSALRATAEIYQATASALQATVTQSATASGWTARLVTPSGDTAMDTGLSAVRTYLTGGSTASIETRQANASALRATAEIYQATASALNLQAVGELAHDAVDSGNPLKLGGKGLEASPANVAHADRVNAYFDKAGRLFTRHGGQGQDQWTATCAPGNGNVRATITRTAPASGVRLVCTGFTATMTGGSGAPSASFMNVQLLDGPSGTNVLWAATLGVPGSAGLTTGVARSNLWLKGSQASALTLEFTVAGGTNVLQSVSMEGTGIVE